MRSAMPGDVKKPWPPPAGAVALARCSRRRPGPAGTVNAVGPGVTDTSIGDGVTALLFSLRGYAEYAVASIWTPKPDAVSWVDAAAVPSSAEAAVGVLRKLGVTPLDNDVQM
jgi:NADPH:quinone reductase-like Zn-dependent oxidoreductase